MFSSTVLATRSTWGRCDSVRSRVGVVGRVQPDGRVDDAVEDEELRDVRGWRRSRRRRTRCCGPPRRRPWQSPPARPRAGRPRGGSESSDRKVDRNRYQAIRHGARHQVTASCSWPRSSQRGAGRPEPAHAVHAASGRRGGRAQVDALQGRAVRVPPRRRPEDHLAERGGTGIDVAADVARVVLLGRHGREGRARQDQVAEAGREPLDLRLDPLGHVHRRTVGDVAVGPQRVPACRCPPGIDHAGLGDEAVRALRMPAGVDLRLAPGDLLERPADVHGDGLPAALRPSTGPARAAPSRPCTRPVRSGSGPARGRSPSGAQSPAISSSWRGVTSSTTARAAGSSSSRFTRWPVSTRPPAARQLGDEGIDDGGAAALDDGPAVAVRQRGEEPWEDAGQRRRQRQHGVGGRAGDERPALLGLEPPGQVLGRGEPAQREAARRQRMATARRAWSPERRAGSCPGLRTKGSEEAAVGPPVGPQRTGRRRRRRAPRPRRASRRGDGRRRSAGVSSRTPWADRSMSRKAGEASSSGCTAEQTSWRNPGSVSSAVRQPPPGSSAASYTSTARPARARTSAATSPFGPAPTTMASAALTGGSQPHGQRLRGPHHGHRALGEAADGPFDLGVAALRSMVEQRDLACAGHGRPGARRTRRPHGRTTLRPPPPRPGGGRRGSGDRRPRASSRADSWYSPMPPGPGPSAVGQWSGM